MNRTDQATDGWHPQTLQERDAVLRELQTVLASPHFAASKRYPALLKYIVENTLAGKSDLLKERTLGVEVFDRPATYDTNADTVVRYTAGEVRKRLLLFYSENGKGSDIRIYLPAGSYVPEFLLGHDPLVEAGSSVDANASHLQLLQGAEEHAGEVIEQTASSQPDMGGRVPLSVWPPIQAASLVRERRRYISGLLTGLLIAVAIALAATGIIRR